MFVLNMLLWGSSASAQVVTSRVASAKPAGAGATARYQGALGAQLKQLQDAWAGAGMVHVLSPILLERGATRELDLPSAALEEETPGCATVALLSSSNLSYVLSFVDGGLPVSQRAWPVPSAAGAAEITRCGTRKKLLRQLQVQMRSRRGVIETLVLLSDDPPQTLSTILKGRDPGESLASPQVGQRPYLQPVSERITRKIAALRRDSAHELNQLSVVSDKTGRGSQLFAVEEGCHRFIFLAPQNKSAPPDLDAHLFEATRDELLVSDEEQSGEASLLRCVGRSERLRVDYNGAHPGSNVTILHARYLLPQGLVRSWGSDARSSLAEALMHSGGPAPTNEPMISAIGVRGKTQWDIELRADTCYLVMVAPIRGESRRISLSATMGLVERRSQSLTANTGATLSFCAPKSAVARVNVHSLGTAVAWVMGIWEIETAALRSSDERQM